MITPDRTYSRFSTYCGTVDKIRIGQDSIDKINQAVITSGPLSLGLMEKFTAFAHPVGPGTQQLQADCNTSKKFLFGYFTTHNDNRVLAWAIDEQGNKYSFIPYTTDCRLYGLTWPTTGLTVAVAVLVAYCLAFASNPDLQLAVAYFLGGFVLPPLCFISVLMWIRRLRQGVLIRLATTRLQNPQTPLTDSTPTVAATDHDHLPSRKGVTLHDKQLHFHEEVSLNHEYGTVTDIKHSWLVHNRSTIFTMLFNSRTIIFECKGNKAFQTPMIALGDRLEIVTRGVTAKSHLVNVEVDYEHVYAVRNLEDDAVYVAHSAPRRSVSDPRARLTYYTSHNIAAIKRTFYIIATWQLLGIGISNIAVGSLEGLVIMLTASMIILVLPFAIYTNHMHHQLLSWRYHDPTPQQRLTDRIYGLLGLESPAYQQRNSRVYQV